MKRKPVLIAAVAIAVVAYLAIRTQQSKRPAPVGAGPVSIKERVNDGHGELSSEWMPLAGFPTAKDQTVDWMVLVNNHPKKPSFIFSIRSGTPDRLVWEGETREPAVLALDDRRIGLQCRRGQLRQSGVVWTVVDCEGTIEDLKHAAHSNRVHFVFAGQTCDLGERGTATLKELLKRSGRE